MKVPGPKSVAELQRYIEGAQSPPAASEEDIDTIVSGLATVLPRRKEDAASAAAKLATYAAALADIPLPDLLAASDHLIRTSQFFPTVFEIRRAADRTMGRRAARIARAQILIRRHEGEWSPPVEVLPAAQFERIKREIGVNLSCDGSGRRRDGQEERP